MAPDPRDVPVELIATPPVGSDSLTSHRGAVRDVAWGQSQTRVGTTAAACIERVESISLLRIRCGIVSESCWPVVVAKHRPEGTKLDDLDELKVCEQVVAIADRDHLPGFGKARKPWG